MKIAISVFGKFHAFYLAHQLDKRHALNQLLTTYPKTLIKPVGVPAERVTSRVSLEVLQRLWARSPRRIQTLWDPQYFFRDHFDRWTSNNLSDGADIFVGWSGSSLKTLRTAQSKGMIGIVERNSSHMLFQQSILEQEFAALGLKYNQTHPLIVQREIEEYEQADFISIPSRFVRKTFIDYGIPESKLIQVPYAADTASFFPMEKKDTRFRIIYCGSVTLRKGVHYLIKAFSELRLSNAELWLIGEMGPEIQPIIKPFLNPHIILMGPKPSNDLKSYFSQGNVFCLPSIEDGFGMVVPQAMACALPVICSRNSGAEELIEEGRNGFLFDARDTGSLKEKLLWCYEHQKDLADMGRASLEQVRQNYTWNDYGERIYAEYLRICT